MEHPEAEQHGQVVRSVGLQPLGCNHSIFLEDKAVHLLSVAFTKRGLSRFSGNSFGFLCGVCPTLWVISLDLEELFDDGRLPSLCTKTYGEFAV